MSKWISVGNNALENWNDNYSSTLSLKEKKKNFTKTGMNSLKELLAINRMPVVKTKRHYNKEDNKDTIKDIESYQK